MAATRTMGATIGRKAVAPVLGPDEYLTKADTDGSGGVSLKELAGLLREVLPHVFTQDENRFQAFVKYEMEFADLDKDGLLNRDEFFMYYYSKLCFDLPPNIELPDGSQSNPGEELFRVYTAFCSYGHSRWSDEMDSKTFIKMCKHATLVDKVTTMKTDSSKLTKQNLDLIFAKVKAKRLSKREMGANKIDFQQFLEVLTRMAQRKKVGVSRIIDQILDHGAPKMPLDLMGFFEVLDTRLDTPAGLSTMRTTKRNSAPGSPAGQSTPRTPGSPAAQPGSPFGGSPMRTSMKGQPVEVYKVSMPGRSWVRNMVTDFIDWAPKDDSGITVRDSLSKSGIWQGGMTFRGGAIPSDEACHSPVATFTPPRPKPGPGTAKDRIETIPWWTARNMWWDEMLPELKDIFMAYNQSQAPPTLHDMQGQTFTQMCVDAGLVCKARMKPGDAMDIFKKVQGGRAKPQRKVPGNPGKKVPVPRATVDINQFVQCLREVCEKVLIAGAPRPDGYAPPPPQTPPMRSPAPGPPSSHRPSSAGSASSKGSRAPSRKKKGSPVSGGTPKQSHKDRPSAGGSPVPSMGNLGQRLAMGHYDGRYANNGGVAESVESLGTAGSGGKPGSTAGEAAEGGAPTPRRTDFSGELDDGGVPEEAETSAERSGDVAAAMAGLRGSSRHSSRRSSRLGEAAGISRMASGEMASEPALTASKEVSQEMPADLGKAASKEASQEISSAPAAKPEKSTSQEIAAEPANTAVSREASRRSSHATEHGSASRRVSHDVAMPPAKAASKEVSQEMPADLSKAASKEASQEISSAPAAKPEKSTSQEIADEPANAGVSREASRRSSHATEHGSASRRVSHDMAMPPAKADSKEASQEMPADLGKAASKEASQEISSAPAAKPEKSTSQEIAAEPANAGVSREASRRSSHATEHGSASRRVSHDMAMPPAKADSKEASPFVSGAMDLSQGSSAMELPAGRSSMSAVEAPDDVSVEGGDEAMPEDDSSSKDGF
eukprot:jgi/Tetstr1/437298/TSEL_002782.t1